MAISLMTLVIAILLLLDHDVYTTLFLIGLIIIINALNVLSVIALNRKKTKKNSSIEKEVQDAS